MAEVQWDDTELRRFLDDVEIRLLHSMVTQVHDEAAGILPRRTGRALSMLASTVSRDAEGLFGRVSTEWYVRFLDTGNPEHPRARQIKKPTHGLPTALSLVERQGSVM